MTLPRIAVAEGALAGLDDLIDGLRGTAEVRTGPVGTPDEVAALTDGADGLVVSLQRLTDAHIAALGRSVRVIGRAGVGLDTIDLDAARARSVAVVYQPDYATNEVADQAMALLLGAHRRVVQADRAVREQGWCGGTDLGPIPALQECTAGVVGTGRIGRAVIARIRPFVRDVLAYDVVDSSPGEDFERVSDLGELLRRAHVVSLHVPLTPDTHHLIDAGRLRRMPPGAVLVNVSRGGLVDEAALAAALHAGIIGAAGLDVFEQEPLPADSPLRDAPNLVLSPHIAWYSSESAPRLASRTMTDVLAVTLGNRPEHGSFAVDPQRPAVAAS
ncbi:C-terminal binding protein [Nakamurella endophytica]|nr:C-terminal binding protein [Nakamurella endophytica]